MLRPWHVRDPTSLPFEMQLGPAGRETFPEKCDTIPQRQNRNVPICIHESTRF